MRLSRTAWLVLGVGFFVIAFACLFVLNSSQAKEGGRLKESLNKAQTQLTKLSTGRQGAETQLAQKQDELAKAQSALTAAKANFPKAVESIENDELLVDIAGHWNLEVSELTASGPQEIKVPINLADKASANIIYTTTTFNVTVRPVDLPPGSVKAFEDYVDETIGNILSFVDEVANGEHFPNAIISSVSMKDLQPPASDEAAASAPKPSAMIKIVIYGYKGE